MKVANVRRGFIIGHGICIETQSPPIGVNNSFLQYSILDVDCVYKKEMKYRFHVEK